MLSDVNSKYRPLPDQALLNRLLIYDPETGSLRWRARTPDLFQDTAKRTKEHNCANWNAQWAGREAFTSAHKGQGYRQGHVLGISYLAHRIIWKMVHGTEPDEIDHENRVRTDNRINNLRDVSSQENRQNMPRSRRNTSGVNGVCWSGNAAKWHAQIRRDGRSVHLGYFDRLEDAAAARRTAERALGYHKNHGRPA